MKSFNFIVIILVIFLKTGNVLSSTTLFNVNNIEVSNNFNTNNEVLANQAIKKGFQELINKVLLEKDLSKLKDLNFNKIKTLVAYYQIAETIENQKNNEIKKIFNIFFDKEKIHDLFYNYEISYSNLSQYEIYFLPIHKKKDQLYVYNQNYFYEKWNEINHDELIEFILPLENIEILQNINQLKDDLLNVDIRNVFQEYSKKNFVLVLIEEKKLNEYRIFLKTNIMGKNINKSFVVEKNQEQDKEFYNNIIINTKKEIVNLIKSQNLIDIRTPSFINIKFLLNKKNNLVELNKRIQKIDLIENLYVQEFNQKYVLLKIKYLGNINKIKSQLKEQDIVLELIADEWSLKFI